jgi:hypothetical protein
MKKVFVTIPISFLYANIIPGAKRQREACLGREPVLEFKLHTEFIEARRIGRIISGG